MRREGEVQVSTRKERREEGREGENLPENYRPNTFYHSSHKVGVVI